MQTVLHSETAEIMGFFAKKKRNSGLFLFWLVGVTVGKPENLPKAALSGLPTCQKNNVTHGVPLQQREWYIPVNKDVPKNIFMKNICFLMVKIGYKMSQSHS